MKTFFISLCLLLLGVLRSNAQCCPYLEEVTIFPDTPTVIDSVYLIAKVSTPSLGHFLGFEWQQQGEDSIVVSACYYAGPATQVQRFEDTLNIGLLASGAWTILFSAQQSPNPDTCVVIDQQSEILSFSVDGTTFVESEAFDQVGIFENPTSGVFQIVAPLIIKRIYVFDVNGKQLQSIDKVQGTQTTINLEGFPAGTYFVRIQLSNGQTGTKKVLLR